MFVEESAAAFRFLRDQTQAVAVTSFRGDARRGAMRVIAAQIPGPLCSVTILVPTAVDNDSGLPHTLEHLVFCGSRTFPRRGYLDTLATRSLSTGTNAWTAEDHTAYTVTTAGAEGMLNVLPVFLDHIVNPTLTDEQFVTEVYHVDGQGKEQGVVFCEMAGRENSEADLLDLAIRRALYSNSTTYSQECGGKTDMIRRLTNDSIKGYHRSLYSFDDVVVIICGSFDTSLVLKSLEEMLMNSPASEKVAGLIRAPTIKPKPLEKIISQIVEFPSADEQIGTIAYSWRGPASSDIDTIVALEVLLRYLQENSASPLNQAFVETANPWASELDFDIKSFVETGIVLYFSGVPYAGGDEGGAMTDDEDPEWGDEDDDEGSSDLQDADDDDDADGEDGEEEDDADDDGDMPPDLFAEGVFKEKLLGILQQVAESGMPLQHLTRTIDRYRRKILENYEDDPHELILGYLIPDVLRHRWQPATSWEDKLDLGSRSRVIVILDRLRDETAEFWMKLTRTWLIDNPVVETLAKPNRTLASERITSDEAALAARRTELGEDGLAKKAEEAKRAFEANQVNLPDSVLASLPPVPRIDGLPKLPVESGIVNVHVAKDQADKHIGLRPFGDALSVQTDTAFVFVRLAFNTAFIPTELRCFLVLFQELLFQSPVQLDDRLLEYTDVVRKCSEIFVSFEAAVGFGNDIWSSSWLSEVFLLTASVEADAKWSESLQFLIQVLLFSQFTQERVLVAVKKLLSDAVELKRDGPSMLAAVTTRLTSSPARGNDVNISIFKQEGFLRSLSNGLKANPKNFEAVKSSLERIRSLLLTSVLGSVPPGFIEIAFPKALALSSNAVPLTPLDSLLSIWDAQVSKFRGADEQNGAVNGNGIVVDHPPSAFPYPREPFKLDGIDSSMPSSVLVPIEGLDASYLSVLTECNVIGTKDFFAVSLLVELLSRTEGPLYTRVRGKGYAYDASLHIAQWTGQLSYEVHESSDACMALQEFFGILEELQTEEGWGEMVSAFNVETARAAVAYKLVSARATAGGIIVSSLRGCLQGIMTMEEQDLHERDLYAMTDADLKRVFDRFLMQFLDPDRRVVVLVTNRASVADSFEGARLPISLKTRTLSQLIY